ncbi:MAG: urocanate hydratase [Bacteroidetes bacterium]|nr:MAG: urocanate hydratase [Bacteroidota bacterium]
MTTKEFQRNILQGVPETLPAPKIFDAVLNHAPKRKDILSIEEKKLAVKNALRYFQKKFHPVLAKEFADELKTYGRIYMYRFCPDYKIYARPINEYPFKSKQAGAIMHMLSNNLDHAIAQHPHELITYGGNGAVFQNWAQYLLTMKYLATMSGEQTLVMYSGHPLGLFPSHKDAPRVVVTNGMMIPNYSKQDDWEKFNALGVTQYGQMTAGSFMYIGPQGIVHGTTITILNAKRMYGKHGRSKKAEGGRENKSPNSQLLTPVFVSSGLGGMSGAQPKAAVIAGVIAVIAEINPKAIKTRHSQGWVDEVYSDLDKLIERIEMVRSEKEPVSLAYQGNIVDLWEKFAEKNIKVELGSDQTSLHNPYAGGYYPVGLSFEGSKKMMSEDPARFKVEVQQSLVRQVNAINKLTAQGMYFFDYGNAFLLEAGRSGADVFASPPGPLSSREGELSLPLRGRVGDGAFKYPSYVQDIMGPMYFDFGFGPFRWVCTSASPKDLETTDKIAAKVLEKIYKKAPKEIKQQLADNIRWIKEAQKNKLVVGSQARILYADAEGRIKIAEAFNKAIKEKKISAPVVLGRDHHDVSGTDSPFRETSNIYDGSQFTADMAVQNFVGDAFRGATWISLHNGGGVGWGEVINGGFGMMLDGTKEANRRLRSMLFWDVNNGIARRSWARNKEAIFAIEREMKRSKNLRITVPNIADDKIIDSLF